MISASKHGTSPGHIPIWSQVKRERRHWPSCAWQGFGVGGRPNGLWTPVMSTVKTIHTRKRMLRLPRSSISPADPSELDTNNLG
eukprot:639753-Amorphochlora_amoeboformis.AAC.1